MFTEQDVVHLLYFPDLINYSCLDGRRVKRSMSQPHHNYYDQGWRKIGGLTISKQGQRDTETLKSRYETLKSGELLQSANFRCTPQKNEKKYSIFLRIKELSLSTNREKQSLFWPQDQVMGLKSSYRMMSPTTNSHEYTRQL